MLIKQFTLDEAVQLATSKWPDMKHCYESHNNSTEWAGETWDDAVEMAYRGDPNEAVHIRQRAESVPQIRPVTRVAAHWDQAGSSLDMGRFMSGDPECMVRVVRKRRPSLALRIAVERSISFSVSQEDIRAVGGSVLAVVEALRLRGVQSEIWVTFTVRPTGGGVGQDLSTQIKIQDAGRPIDMDRLAYWVANPAAFRRIGFAMEEHYDKDIRYKYGFMSGGGYGSPSRPDPEDWDEVAPANQHQVDQWITDVLSRRGGN